MSNDTPWHTYLRGVHKLGSKPATARRSRVKAIKPDATSDAKTGAEDIISFAALLDERDSATPAQKISKATEAKKPPNQPLSTTPSLQISLSRRVERALRSGDVVPDATLDLHGMTEAKAHQAVMRFIPAQHKRGTRLLLIITGKGRGADGVLRRNFPRWCETPDLAKLILALRPAALRHGATGACYVILRK